MVAVAVASAIRRCAGMALLTMVTMLNHAPTIVRIVHEWVQASLALVLPVMVAPAAAKKTCVVNQP